MKTEVLIVLLLAVALAVAYFVFSKPAYPLTEQDAKRFFQEDLASKYSDADTKEIIEILPLTSQDGTPYYQLKARVTKGADSPCPERIHVYYDYPPKNFVSQPPEYITRGCRICINEPSCIIAFPEEAIIASHTYPGTEEVASFVRNNSDATASASIGNFRNYTDVWVVSWSTPDSFYGYYVVLSKGQNRVLDVVPEQVKPMN